MAVYFVETFSIGSKLSGNIIPAALNVYSCGEHDGLRLGFELF